MGVEDPCTGGNGIPDVLDGNWPAGGCGVRSHGGKLSTLREEKKGEFWVSSSRAFVVAGEAIGLRKGMDLFTRGGGI